MSQHNPHIQNKSTLSTIIQSLATPIFVKDKSHKFVLVNQALCSLIGVQEDELIGKSDYDFFPNEQADIFWEKDNQVFSSRLVNINEEKITTANGEEKYIETKKIVFVDEEIGDVLCGVITDITDIKEYQNQLDQANSALSDKVRQRTLELEVLNKKLEAIAYSDQLTGLMNRTAFDLMATDSIGKAYQNRTKIAFLFLDMDSLKFVNDSYGHPVGDMLIKEAGHRLSKLLPDKCELARIGGDEFLIMLPYDDFSAVEILAQTVSNQMQQPVKLINKSLTLSSSIGVACFPDHGQDWISLFQNADCAMYAAKNNCKGSFEIYQQRFTIETKRRLELEHELISAVDTGRIEVFFQPILNTSTQILCGYEALARWNNDTFGSVSPEEFITIAEQSDLIITLGDIVLQKSLQFINTHCHNNEYVSVNVSPKQLQNQHYSSSLIESIEKHQVNPKQLTLEITESILTEASVNLKQISKAMSAKGINIFVDDFGTGYSNLMQLRHLTFSTLKIDQSFIKDLPNSEIDRSLVKAIALMAQELNLKVIAEGVETNEQRQCLVEIGIHYGQGYYWNKAQSPQYWSELLPMSSNS